ncbi:hypothetical protein KUTeg_010900 [Tegillarca granosa]|uniref:Uncharacterized protein n=1 Tax=Tegillarca granosa TaxID=220873 RepID=A0ABQ9F5L7_TEGGR|nr:hypothetical protein KUTeg_010900 [Tegillarca granosa]
MLKISASLLAKKLTQFYLEATSQDPKKTRISTIKSVNKDGYTASTVMGIRAGIKRHLLDLNRNIDIVHDREFKKANQILNEIFKESNKERKNGGTSSNPTDKIITADDLMKISTYLYRPVFDPETLRLCTWYILAIHFNAPDMDWFYQLPKKSFEFVYDDFGKEYACLTQKAKQKILKWGGYCDDQGLDRRIFATNMDSCPVRVLKLFMAKTSSYATKFFNKLITRACKFPNLIDIWYSDIPFEKFKSFFPEISEKAGCSRRYSSQCLKATVMQADHKRCHKVHKPCIPVPQFDCRCTVNSFEEKKLEQNRTRNIETFLSLRHQDEPEISTLNVQPEKPSPQVQPEMPILEVQQEMSSLQSEAEKPNLQVQPKMPNLQVQPKMPNLQVQPEMLTV